MPQLTGRFPPGNIARFDVPRPPEGLLDIMRPLSGVVCLVSDALDDLGVAGVVPAGVLKPVMQGRAIVGPALTVKKVRVDLHSRRGLPRGDIEAHNLTSPGDVLVIEGFDEVSNMGGLSAMTSSRQGALGAVVWGGCRDVAEIRELGYPVWSTAVTPVTGVGRIDSEVINGDVRLGAIPVRCGDIIVAGDDGVCVVPRERAVEVAERVRRRAAADERRARMIRDGVSVVQLACLAHSGEQPPSDRD